MKKFLFFLVTVFIILNVNITHSQDSSSVNERAWYIPDYAKIQFAGNIGFISIGPGYKIFDNVIQSDILYGFVPHFIGGTTIHSLVLKNTLLPYGFKLYDFVITPIAGFTINFDLGNHNSNHVFSQKYPDDYYKTNSIHYTIYIGCKIFYGLNDNSFINGLDFYAEVGTVDISLKYQISNNVKLIDILSLALGMNFYF
jgi:hypothetical protein